MAYEYDPSKMTNTYQAERRTLNPPGFNSPATNTVDALERNTSQYGGFTRENQRGRFQSDSQRDADLRNQGLSGTWTSGQGGPQITDLTGYLGMKEQQSAGSDFSGYQNQLNSLVGHGKNKYQDRLDALLSDPSKIQQTAGYQFDVDQGNQAINRSAAAKGMGNSGGVLAELASYGQGMASREYGNQVSRMAGLSAAERANRNTEINTLSGLMQNAQQFGISSGRYNPEQYTQSLGIRDIGGGGSRTAATPRPQVNPYDAQVDRENAQIANQQRIYAEHDKTFDTPRWR